MSISYDEHAIDLCKCIRHNAILNRVSYRLVDKLCDEAEHLIQFLSLCGVSTEEFIKMHLENLQIDMICGEEESIYYSDVIISTPFAVNLRVRLENKEELIVTLEKGDKKGWIYSPLSQNEMQYAFVDCIADNTYAEDNLYSVKLFVPVGVMCVPVVVLARQEFGGVFSCRNRDLLDELTRWVDIYIKDLYTSNLEFQALNEVEIFSVSQPYAGNSIDCYVDRLSVLLENMYVNEHPLHRKSAAFALIMYTILVELSDDEKEGIILKLGEKYEDKREALDLLEDLIKNFYQ